ncbi:MAG: hypothetical protein Ta2D_13760 [Rickettsiales bacterium]|nr:MAG: hypothetical protein Ta2D_13760 [Rickettsiales bacterium]
MFFIRATIEKEKFVELLKDKKFQELLGSIPVEHRALPNNLETIKSNIADFVLNANVF